jgi:hypothetical protein
MFTTLTIPYAGKLKPPPRNGIFPVVNWYATLFVNI